MYESCFTRVIHIKSIRYTHKEPNASGWTPCAYWVSLKLRGTALALVYSSQLKRKPPLCRCATPSNHKIAVLHCVSFVCCAHSEITVQKPSFRGYSASCVLEAGVSLRCTPSKNAAGAAHRTLSLAGASMFLTAPCTVLR
jgi:hypothetical protein